MGLVMKKIFAIVLALVFAFAATGVTAFADCGPKPSTTVFVRNIEGSREYYATLLCDTDWLPPGNGAYGGDDPEYIVSQDNAWRAFYEYAKTDEFFFLQKTFKRIGNGSFSWDYAPPNRFKVALYFPDDGSLLVSEVLETYAFDSYFNVKVVDGEFDISNGNKTDKGRLEVANALGSAGMNIGTLIIRVVITILIEIITARFFGIRNSKATKLILGVNIVTQLLLNIVLTGFALTLGFAAGLVVYIPMEILIIAVESGAYASSFPKYTGGEVKAGKAAVYSLAANAASFIVGGVIYLLLVQ